MAVAIGLWNLVITPGKPEAFIPQSDLRITNVALGDELADESGRTTVKLTYQTLVDIDDDESADEEEAPQEPISTTVLCSLTAGKIEQTTVDLVLEEEEEYLFEVVGKNTVYLTGNYIDQTPPQVPYNDEDSDMDSEDAYDLREVSSDVEVDPAELDSDQSRFEEVVEANTSKSQKRPRDSDAMDTDAADAAKPDKKANKKLKAADGKAVAAEAAAVEKKDKKEKKEKKEAAPEGDKKEKKEKAAAPSATREIAGGVKVRDTKIGSGPMAKKGNSVSMRYVGKLQNGKVFDKNVKGKPFTFHLGKGEVIKGWDEGLVGMQVGGERLLTIPPNMAYGKKKMDDIPANSTLIFECKLVEIK